MAIDLDDLPSYDRLPVVQDLPPDCARDGVYEFMLTSAPLDIPGGDGSPPNVPAIR